MSAPRNRSKARGALMSAVALVMLINSSIQLTQLHASAQSHHLLLMSNNKTQSTTSDSLQAAPSSQPKQLLQGSGGSQQLRNQVQFNRNNENDQEALLASANHQPAAVEVDVEGGDSTSGSSDIPDSASTTSSSDELDGDEEPTGSGDVPVASDEDDSHSASSTGGSTTETSPYEAVHLRPSRQSHAITQQQPAPTTPTTTTLRAIVASRVQPPASGVALDVNMGADLMLIKPAITWADSTTTTSSTPLMSDEIDRRNLVAFQARHNQLVNKNKQQQQQQSVDLLNSLASSPVPLRTTTTGELAVESVNHQQVERPLAGDQVELNERRQDLLLHSQHNQNFQAAGEANLPAETTFNQQQFNANVNMPQSSNGEHHSACYTPISLISVILITMLITIALCLGARQLFKYLSRHQFDLVENSKHFQPTTTTTSNSKRTTANCSLHLFQHDAQCQKCQFNQTASTTNPHCPAFRNPYFTESGGGGGGSLVTQQQQQQHHQPVGLLKTTGANPDEQMNFIESHIANLHSRQVTSSVKELSSLSGHPLTALPPTPQVVDLTSGEQRARILANPREGDLISVDISGHDIIGLGFDLCGNQRDGIFVRSVQSRGPARESGAIQPGDRLKCLNVSFEQVTLQDACDLLNSAGPYKMRLLIEKKAVSGLELKQLTGGLSSKSSDMLESPLDATRAYLRKLTGKLTGGSSSSSSSANSNGENPLVTTSGSQSPAQVQVPPVGSAGARALRHSRRALRNAAPESGACHVNEAFNLGSAEDDVSVGGQVEITQHVRKQSRKQSTSSSSRSTSTATTAATHKLRGPPMASEAVIDLRQLANQDDDDDLERHISPRRQSVDTTTTTTSTTVTSRLMNVERSMSQGQLANLPASSDSNQQATMTNNDDHGH